MKRRWLPLARYARPEAGALTGLVILMLAGVALDTLKPWPLKLIIDSVLAAKPLPAALGGLSSLPWAASALGLLGWLTAGTVLLFLAGWGVKIWQSYLQVGAGVRMMYGLGAELFDRLQRLSLRFHGRQPTGDLVRRVTSDSNCVRELVVNVLLPLFGSLVSLVVMFSVMWSMDRPLSLLAIAAAPFLGLSIRKFARPLEERTYEQLNLQGEVMALAEQTLTALPVVRAFARESHEDGRYAAIFRRSDRAYLRAIASQMNFKIGVDSVTALGTAAVMMMGGWHVLQGKLTVGGLLVFLSYLASLYAPLETLAYLSYSYANAVAGARRVFEILGRAEEIHDQPGARALPPARGGAHIRLENVTVGHEPGRPVLKNVTLEVQPGEAVAIVGPTGAGKTTLVSLVPRFLDPWEGQVLIDGHDLRDVKLRSLRSQVALVLQEPFILPQSVAENIAYGRPHAHRDEIVAAAKAANADEFIRRLPQGYDSVLGERGATLSGGERQRLAIARALLKDAPILILDEPTSAVDPETEASILEAMERLTHGRTTLTIAHRLSTIRGASRIVVLQEGQIVECGTHSELEARGGLYAGLRRKQFGAEPAALTGVR